MNELLNKYFDENGHFTEKTRILYAEASLNDSIEQLPQILYDHICDCLICAVDTMDACRAIQELEQTALSPDLAQIIEALNLDGDSRDAISQYIKDYYVLVPSAPEMYNKINFLKRWYFAGIEPIQNDDLALGTLVCNFNKRNFAEGMLTLSNQSQEVIAEYAIPIAVRDFTIELPKHEYPTGVYYWSFSMNGIVSSGRFLVCQPTDIDFILSQCEDLSLLSRTKNIPNRLWWQGHQFLQNRKAANSVYMLLLLLILPPLVIIAKRLKI